MSEWQPVRIAPVDGKRHYWSDQTGPERKNGVLRDSLAGKIVRVRPAEDDGWICEGRIFEWHPQDIERFIPHPCCRMTCCEHQILAD
jgi:hypothetical protein